MLVDLEGLVSRPYRIREGFTDQPQEIWSVVRLCAAPEWHLLSALLRYS